MSIHDKANFTQWYDPALILLLAILFVLLPSINSNELMQGTMSGKMFFFLYAVLVCGLLSSLKFIVGTSDCIAFSAMDGVLSLWIAYILVNGWSQHIPMSNRFFELLGLILLYILLRQIRSPRYGILLLAIVFGATIQAIIGNLQLWGAMPSHHALFKMTGSFFNPGPFAGFLVSVFPVILGVLILKKNLFPMVGANVNQAVAWIKGSQDVNLADLANATEANAECVSTSFNNGSCGISNNCFWGRGDSSNYNCDTTRG